MRAGCREQDAGLLRIDVVYVGRYENNLNNEFGQKNAGSRKHFTGYSLPPATCYLQSAKIQNIKTFPYNGI